MMRVKTSISLPKELLDRIDRVEQNRSGFLEKAARAYIASLERRLRNVRDLQILNTRADRLNAEARDVLDYQTGFRRRSGPTRWRSRLGAAKTDRNPDTEPRAAATGS